MRWSGCKRPQSKRTKAGTRCAQVCSNGRIKFLPIERCGLRPAEKNVSCGCGA